MELTQSERTKHNKKNKDVCNQLATIINTEITFKYKSACKQSCVCVDLKKYGFKKFTHEFNSDEILTVEKLFEVILEPITREINSHTTILAEHETNLEKEVEQKSKLQKEEQSNYNDLLWLINIQISRATLTKLQYQTAHDDLTTQFNRYKFYTKLENEVKTKDTPQKSNKPDF